MSATVYCIFQPIPHTEDVAQKYLPLTIIIIAKFKIKYNSQNAQRLSGIFVQNAT
jgi:hypothetical protein